MAAIRPLTREIQIGGQTLTQDEIRAEPHNISLIISILEKYNVNNQWRLIKSGELQVFQEHKWKNVKMEPQDQSKLTAAIQQVQLNALRRRDVQRIDNQEFVEKKGADFSLDHNFLFLGLTNLVVDASFAMKKLIIGVFNNPETKSIYHWSNATANAFLFLLFPKMIMDADVAIKDCTAIHDHEGVKRAKQTKLMGQVLGLIMIMTLLTEVAPAVFTAATFSNPIIAFWILFAILGMQNAYYGKAQCKDFLNRFNQVVDKKDTKKTLEFLKDQIFITKTERAETLRLYGKKKYKQEMINLQKKKRAAFERVVGTDSAKKIYENVDGILQDLEGAKNAEDISRANNLIKLVQEETKAKIRNYNITMAAYSLSLVGMGGSVIFPTGALYILTDILGLGGSFLFAISGLKTILEHIRKKKRHLLIKGDGSPSIDKAARE